VITVAVCEHCGCKVIGPGVEAGGHRADTTGAHRRCRPAAQPPTTAPASAMAAPTSTPRVNSPVRRAPRGSAGGGAVYTTPASLPVVDAAVVDAAAGTASRPANTSSTAAKNSPAVFFATPASIRCPTPPIMPPTTAPAE